ASATAPLQILLVEDHVDTRNAMSFLLRRQGHTVAIADTVESAYNVFSEQPIDVILTDLLLPDGNGWELVERVRRHRDVAAIAISGCCEAEDCERSAAHGFARHLIKPIDPSHLIQALNEIVERRSANQAERAS
ncbi:MAG TPA: response regulator, partial [Chthoniobacteraceae bacterium]